MDNPLASITQQVQAIHPEVPAEKIARMLGRTLMGGLFVLLGVGLLAALVCLPALTALRTGTPLTIGTMPLLLGCGGGLGAVLLGATIWSSQLVAKPLALVIASFKGIWESVRPGGGSTAAAVLVLCLARPVTGQAIGTPIAAHPGDTLRLTYVVAGSPTAIRVVTSSGKILVQSKLTITARPTPPPPDTTPAKPPVDTTPVTPPPPAAGTAWLLEDFTEYGGSTATFKADPRHIYSTGEDGDFASIGTIDTVGGASWRLDFPARSACTDYSIGRNLTLPSATAELWLEVVARFGTGVTPGQFTTKVAACTSSNADYKFVLPRVYTSGRFNLMVGTYGTEYTFGYPGGEDNWEGGNASAVLDGRWHTFRMHLKVGASGTATLWIDGAIVKDYGAVAIASNLVYGIALGRNMNQGPDHPESLWWRRVAAWQTNPGW